MRQYPKVPRRVVTDVYFGTPVEDPYRYLEDKHSPETLRWVAEENAYTKAWFDGRTDFKAKDFEAALRAKEKPLRLGSIEEAAGVRCASHSLEGGMTEVVLLDENWQIRETLLNDEMLGNRMHVYAAEPCPAKPGVFAVRTVKHGAPRCCCVVYDANEGRIIAELDDIFGSSWAEDGLSILYSDAQVDTAHNRNINRVRRYWWQEDRLETLYTHPDNAVFIGVTPAPKDGFMLEVKVDYGNNLMVYLAADGAVTRLNRGVGDCTYMGEKGGRCYFKTNTGAPMARVISIAAEDLTREEAMLNAFTVALPEGDALLSAVGLVREGILALHERDAVAALSLYDLQGHKLRDIPLPDPYGTVAASDVMHLSDAGHIFLQFQSFTHQPMVLMYDDAACQVVTILESRSDDTGDIAVDQCFLPARDGQRILVYLVRPKDLAPSGDTPVLMYGYGGYASSANPSAENYVTGHAVVEWVRKGRIYAHCILRGGSEYGTPWHEAGMMLTKKNAFHDFIDIAQYLVDTGWTKPARIVATGMSNGGLLMTAITTIRPDLFGTVIASVPHTDMLRFRNDDRGMMYVTEYGDPLAGPEMFAYMHSYSPYHNIKPGQVYPRIYVQTGEMDNNVPSYHGKKFGIRLQQEASQEHPVLLEVLAHGSHNRGVGDEYYFNVAQIQAFIEIGLAGADEGV